MLRSFPLIVMLVCALMSLQAREKQLFNDNWQFSIVDDESADFSETDAAVSGWEMVKIPHTPRLEPLVVNDQWQGICWYRKSFNISSKDKGQKLYLRFEGAMNVADVWVNGTKVMQHVGGYLPFVIDITDVVKYDGENSIAVKLDNRDNKVTGPKPLERLDFNMYGGIYRNVWLIKKNPLHITDPFIVDKPASGGVFITQPYVDWTVAEVNIKTHITNETDHSKSFKLLNQLCYNDDVVKSEFLDELVLDAGESKDIIQELKLKHPHLWSPQDPFLYELKTIVVCEGEFVDQEINRIGLRQFVFRDNALYINGNKTFLRGVNRHQEYPYIGYALSDNDQYRDAVKIKEAGFDYVRLSHYPHSEAFMDACDELGLVTLDAVLGWQYFGDKVFQDHVVKTARHLIRRDRNRASVLAWEVSLNESGMSKEFMDRIHNAAHEEYPGKYCYTAGWRDYAYDIFVQARQHRIGHKPHNHKKPYIVSEYGDWEYYAQNAGLNQDSWGGLKQEERSSRQLLSDGERRLQQQALNIQEAHNDNFTTPAFADGYWVMYDYNRGYTSDLESSGIMSIHRVPKFSYFFYQSQRNATELDMRYASGPMAYIATYWSDSSSTTVKVYSNCEKVELMLNDQSLGTQLPDSGALSTHLNNPPFTFEIPKFATGKLVAKGLIKDKEVTRYDVETPGAPVAIDIVVDESGRVLEAGVKDHAFVYIRLLDKNGTVVPLNGNDIDVTLKGDAKLLNKEAIITEAGVATALIEIGDKKGKIQIDANWNSISGALRYKVK